MENNTSPWFTQLVANFFGSAVLVLLALIITLSLYWDHPSYVPVISVIFLSILGTIVTKKLAKKYPSDRLLRINLMIFIVMALFILFFLGIEDWVFVGQVILMSFGWAIIPAILFSAVIPWTKILKRKQ